MKRRTGACTASCCRVPRWLRAAQNQQVWPPSHRPRLQNEGQTYQTGRCTNPTMQAVAAHDALNSNRDRLSQKANTQACSCCCPPWLSSTLSSLTSQWMMRGFWACRKARPSATCAHHCRPWEYVYTTCTPGHAVYRTGLMPASAHYGALRCSAIVVSLIVTGSGPAEMQCHGCTHGQCQKITRFCIDKLEVVI